MIHNCEYCEKSFNVKSRWRKHVRVHTGEKPFTCQMCGKRFADDSSRLSHSKTHDVNRIPFKCDICGKDFSRNSNLNAHMITHSRESEDTSDKVQYSNSFKLEAVLKAREIGTEKASQLLNIPSVTLRSWLTMCKAPKTCQFCGKIFAAPSLLERHVKTVHDENTDNTTCNRKTTEAFKEEVRSFASVSSVQTVSALFKVSEATVRRWIKLNANPFKCENCDKSFAYENELSKHKMNKHGGAKYKPKVGTNRETFSSFIGAKMMNSTFDIHFEDDLGDAKKQRSLKCTEDVKIERKVDELIHETADNDFDEIMDERVDDTMEEAIKDIKHEFLGQEHCNEGYIDDAMDKIMNETVDDELENAMDDKMEDELFDLMKEPLDQELCKEEVLDNEITEPRLSKYFTIPGRSRMFRIFVFVFSACAAVLIMVIKIVVMENELHAEYEKAETEAVRVKDQGCLKKDLQNLYKEKKRNKSEAPIFTCSYCGKDFKLLYYLDRHIVKHTGEKKYQCDECPQLFAYKQDIPRHKLTHQPGRVRQFFKCSFPSCGKSLTTKHAVRTHEELHGEGFVCDDCGQSFPTKGRMNRHSVKAHTKAFSLYCEKCGKGYMQKDVQRFKNHTEKCAANDELEQKLLHCPVCSKVFEKKQRFDRHMQSHSKSKYFQCDQCQKLYADKYNLERHVERVHKEN